MIFIHLNEFYARQVRAISVQPSETQQNHKKNKIPKKQLTRSLARSECFWTTLEKPEALESAIV